MHTHPAIDALVDLAVSHQWHVEHKYAGETPALHYLCFKSSLNAEQLDILAPSTSRKCPSSKIVACFEETTVGGLVFKVAYFYSEYVDRILPSQEYTHAQGLFMEHLTKTDSPRVLSGFLPFVESSSPQPAEA